MYDPKEMVNFPVETYLPSCVSPNIAVALETASPGNAMELFGGPVGLTIRTVQIVARANVG